MKIFLSLLLLFSSVYASHPISSPYPFKTVSWKLNTAVDQLMELPEATTLLRQINQEGPISLSAEEYGAGGFNAVWDAENRTITINLSKKPTLGKQICALLFEMHNAASNQTFLQYDHMAQRGEISKSDYVYTIEWIEHQNALRACELIEKGIDLNIFPQDAHWPIYKDFGQHFALQQRSGHSDFIAHNFEKLNYFS